ncbi:hypothetical protein GGQ01_002804 [Salinibacter ruber]|uniref:Secretion system C-terminal sorting domain-containing protein n=2 Tax=Salinibacter ruber TaxID=146919 RepID=A0A9X2UNA6_9BACT|nr:hypothetical protein [Salinibacter ruber]
MDPSETNIDASDAASADGMSTADPGDMTPGTADMTSQNPTASAMNPSRLLRTALLSVLGLLLTGGLMAVQAQQIYVDNANGNNGNDGTSPSDAVKTLDEAISKATTGNRIEVEATGPYSATTVDKANLEFTAASSTKPVVDGGNNVAFDVTVDGTIIDGFEIRSDLSNASAVVNSTDPTNDPFDGTLTLLNNNIVGEAGGASGQGNRIVRIKSGLDAEGNVFESSGSTTKTIGIRGSSTTEKVEIGGSASSQQNTFRGIRVAVQIEDGAESSGIEVVNNVFDDIDQEAVIFADNGGEETENITVTSNDFGGSNGGVGGGVFFLDDSSGSNFTGTLSVTNNNFTVDSDVNGIAIAATGGSFDGSDRFDNSGTQNVFAKNNYYGASDGPSQNSGFDAPNIVRGSGAEVTRDVEFLPFLDAEGGSSTFYGDQITVNRDVTTDAANLTFDSFEEGVQRATPSDVIVVEGIVDQSNYSGTDPSDFQSSDFQSDSKIEIVGVGASDDRVSEVTSSQTVTVRATGADVSLGDALEFDNSFNQNNDNVTVQVEASNSSFLAQSGSGIDLYEGRVTIDTDGDLRLADGGEVERGDSDSNTIGTLVSGSITFEGAFDFTYDIPDENITDGNELPSSPEISTLTINSNGDTGNRLTIQENVTVTNDLSFDGNDGNLTVDGNLDVQETGTVLVDNNSDLSVTDGNTLTLTATDAVLDVDGTLNQDSGLSSPGDLDFQNLSSNNLQVLQASGATNAGDVTIRLDDGLVSDGAPGDTLDAVLTSDGGTVEVEGTVDTDLKGTSNTGDVIFVQFSDNGSSNTIEVGGGDNFGPLDDFDANDTQDAKADNLVGTIEFTGDATVTYPSSDNTNDAEATVALGETDEGGAVDVAEGATLTIVNQGDPGGSNNSLLYTLGTLKSGDDSAPGSFTGSGTLALGGSFPHNIDVTEEGTNDNEVDGVIEPSITANQDLTIGGDGTQSDDVFFSDIGGLEVSDGSFVTFENTDVRNVVTGDTDVRSNGTLLLEADELKTEGTFTLEPDASLNASGVIEVGNDFVINETSDLTYSASIVMSGAGDGALQFDRSVSGGDLTVDKTAAQATIDASGLEVSGLTVQNPGDLSGTGGSLVLNTDLSITGSGTVEVNSEDVNGNTDNSITGSGAIVFAGSGGTIQDTDANAAPTVGSIRVDVGSSNSVSVSDDFLFSGTLSLETGGVDIDGNPSDLSPVGESSAVSIVAGNTSSIDAVNSNSDSFNGEGNAYDVEYVGDGSIDTSSEITANVRDLRVSPSGSVSNPEVTATLKSNAAPSGDVTVDASGILNSDNATLDINDASSVTVDGELNATLASVTGSQTIAGSGTLGDVTADGSSADLTIDGLSVVGTVTATGGSSTSLSLTGASDGNQTVDRIVADGDAAVTLASNVTVDTDGIGIGGGSSAGTLDLAGNNLTIEAGDLIGTANADFQAGDGGNVVLDTDGIADVSRDGPVTNVRLVSLGGSNGFGVDNELAFDGNATLAGDIVDGGASSFEGSLVAVGSTITINGTSDKRLPNLIVDSGDGETTTVLDPSGSNADDPESGTDEPNAENLVVSGELTFASGELDHQTSVEVGESLTYAPASEDAADFAVTASGGSVVLDGANVTLNRALTVPSLETSGGSSLVANSDDNPFDLRIGSDLTLGAPFDASADNTGDLVITSAEGENVQVERTSYSGTDVLTQPLVFEEPGTTYDLIYTGSSDINSGLEAVDGSGQGQIDSLKVNASATVTFSDAELSGSVTANERLELLDGTVQHTASDERQVAIADGATLLRDDGRFADRTAPSDQVNADGAYTLVYASDGEEDGVGDATDEEFLSDTEIDLVVRTAEDGDTDEVLNVLPGNRTVSSLTVENDTGDETSLGDGSDSFTLTVNGGTEINGGLLDGSLNAQGDVTVAEGDVSEAALTFAGNSDQALSLSETEEVSGIELAQTTPDGESVPSVTVSGGGLEPTSAPTFGNGLLVVEGDNALDLGTNGFSRSTADEDTSHVIGSVTQRVNSGNTVVEYPVGSSNASYRPFGFIFPEAPTQDTDITVTHVDENPGEVGGLPFTDNTEEGVRIGQDYPDYYWTTESSRRLSISGTYEAFAQAEDLRFPDESADDFRIIRRPDSGDSWSLVGDGGTGYSNAPISESEGRVDVSTTAATSDIRRSVGLFTIGQPAGDAPQIATNEGLTLTEGESAPITSAELEATDGDNAAGELTFEVTSGPSQGEIQVDGSQSSTFTQADVNNELVSYDHTASSSDDDSFELEVSDPNGNSVSATFDVTVEVGQVAISGSVNYPTVENGELVDGRALEGVEVEATSGDVTATDTTDADGNFTISGLDSGDYEVTANVDRDVSNVSIGDAQRTVSGFAGTEPFAGAFQEEVADVNASGTANATDALRIAFFDLGSISSFEAGSFLVDTTEVTLGSESESGVSIRVAEFGDADLSGGSSDSGGDASLATTTVSPKSSAQTAAKSATESAGDANRVAAGETFEVPVRVDRGAEVGSYSLSLEYDTEKATFEGISSGRDDIITNGSKEDGTLQVGWFDRSGESTLELTGGSELVTLRFSAAEGVEGAEFAPEITSGEINGPGAKAVTAGVETQAVRIAKPAPDEFALNGSYPNPASQQATVEMDLPVRAQVTVEVYNTLGQRVQTVEQSMSAGAGQTVQLDASQLASGQYFYRVKASLDGNQTRETGRLTIVK